MSFTVGDDGSPYATYKVGADTVTKKLGSGDITGVCAKTQGRITVSHDADKFYMVNPIGQTNVWINGVTINHTQYWTPDSNYGGFVFRLVYFDHPLKTGDIIAVTSNPTGGTTNGGGFAIIY